MSSVIDEFWQHHCIESKYGVDHGDLYLHNSVVSCSSCGTINPVFTTFTKYSG